MIDAPPPFHLQIVLKSGNELSSIKMVVLQIWNIIATKYIGRYYYKFLAIFSTYINYLLSSEAFMGVEATV